MGMHHQMYSMKLSENKIFWVSFFVFTVLNMVENVIHYNIGRDTHRDSMAILLHMPSGYDIARIVCIMTLFGILQAAGTCYFLGC